MFTTSGIQLGPVMIYWYALIIVSGAMLALAIVLREAKKFDVSAERIIDLFFIMMIGGIIGTRLYYVIFQWQLYQNNPLEIFNLRAGGLAIYGGLIGGALVAYLASKGKIKMGTFEIKPFNFMLLLDMIVPSVLLAQGIGRWGNFINKEAYGAIVPGINAAEQVAYLKSFFIPDFVIQGMNITGAYRQPTFFYESVWDILGFLIIILLIRNRKHVKLSIQTAAYMIWYGCGRFVIEGMRTDSLYLFGDIRVSQVVSVILVLIGLGLLALNYFRAKTIPQYREAKFEGEYRFLRKTLDK